MARLARIDTNIVTADIERVPGTFSARRGGLTISGDFWDLSQHKQVLGRRISPDEVTEWPRTICAAWRRYGKKRVEFAAEWQPDGAAGMAQRLWTVLDEADVLVGHNFASFDSKHLNTLFRDNGLAKPSPYKIVDTLSIARRTFGDESKTLDALCKRIGIDAKTDKYSIQMARDACDGNREAQRKLAAYNRGDIVASEALYDELRPWAANLPAPAGMPGDAPGNVPTCTACGSTDLVKNGTAVAQVLIYQRYRCRHCGANVRGRQHLAGSGRIGITRMAL